MKSYQNRGKSGFGIWITFKVPKKIVNMMEILILIFSWRNLYWISAQILENRKFRDLFWILSRFEVRYVKKCVCCVFSMRLGKISGFLKFRENVSKYRLYLLKTEQNRRKSRFSIWNTFKVPKMIVNMMKIWISKFFLKIQTQSFILAPVSMEFVN